MNTFERLRTTAGVTAVEARDVEAFVAAEDPGFLVVLGDTARRPEASDVAVVMRDIATRTRGLRIGVVVDEGAAAAKAALGATKEPVIAVLRRGVVARLLEGMQDWAVYAGAVKELATGAE